MKILPAKIRVILGALLLLPPALSAKTIDLATATIPELQHAYDDGLASEQVVKVYLQRIAAYDKVGPKLNAILQLNPHALDEARALDAERRLHGPRSPLHGVPILIKDNIDTADVTTTGGARAFAGTAPPADAFVIARLRAAGVIILAKTNLDEFAFGATGTSSLGGQTLNPYNLEKIPGGSSAGSAVGVAALFGWAALGTETGSSIRNPSAKADLVGFCPSAGLVSRRGVIPCSIVYDRVGPIARNVTDAALFMSVMAGFDPGDLLSLQSLGHPVGDSYSAALNNASLKGARIGVLRQLFGQREEDPPAITLIDAAIATMRAQGATVIDPLPTDIDLWKVTQDVSGGHGDDTRDAFDYYLSTRGPGFPYKTMAALAESGGILERTKSKFLNYLKAPSLDANGEYAANYRDRVALRQAITALMDQHHLDALISPFQTKVARTLAVEVPDGIATGGVPDNRGVGRNNHLSTATGLPTIVMPVGFNHDGVNVGLEFLGRQFDEATLIRITHAFEQAAPHRQLPPTTPLLGIEQLHY